MTSEGWRPLFAEAAGFLDLPPKPVTVAGTPAGLPLPKRLAIATLAARLADLDSALRTLAEPIRFTVRIEES